MLSKALRDAITAGLGPAWATAVSGGPQASHQVKPTSGSDLLYIKELGRGITRRALLNLRAVGKRAVSKSVDGEGYNVYIDLANDGQYNCDGEFPQDEANRLVARLSSTISEFMGCNLESNVPIDEEGYEVDVERVRMVTLPGVVGAAMAIEDIVRIVGLSLRVEGSNAFVDVRWEPSRGLPSTGLKVNDEGCTSALDIARRAEQVFASVVNTVNEVQLATGMQALMKITPVIGGDDDEPAAPADQADAAAEGLG